MGKKISIIVPIYNVEQFLEKCIESILKQTYKNLEIILVNDGSTDSSKDICEKYKGLDNRISVIHKINGGVSSARNCGIDNVTGDYILFVDPDDYIEKDMVNKLYSKAVETEADIVICQYYYVENNDIKNRDKICTQEVWNKYDIINMLLKNDEIQSHLWNKLFRVELFENTVFPNGKVYEDYYVMHNLFLKSEKICWIDDKLYYYIQRGNSIVHSFTSKNIIDFYLAVRKRWKDLEGVKGINIKKVYCNLISVYMDVHLIMTKHKYSDNEKEYIESNLELLEKDFLEIKNRINKDDYSNFSRAEILKYKVICKSKRLYKFMIRLLYNDELQIPLVLFMKKIKKKIFK